jgi:hypothetical protein
MSLTVRLGSPVRDQLIDQGSVAGDQGTHPFLDFANNCRLRNKDDASAFDSDAQRGTVAEPEGRTHFGGQNDTAPRGNPGGPFSHDVP